MSAKITQEQYDRWIKNMSKNKSGTSFIILNQGDGNLKRKKLYKDDMNQLYFFDVDDYKKIIYCHCQPKWEEQTWNEIIQQQQQEELESQEQEE